jgi:hypothetical protein
LLREDRKGGFLARTQSPGKGKKRESILEVDGKTQQPTVKRCSILGQGSVPPSVAPAIAPVVLTSTMHIDLMDSEPMSIGEIVFNAALSGLELDDCKSSHLVKNVEFNSCPFFKGSMIVPTNALLSLSILVDSKASASFINDEFVTLHGLKTDTLDSPFRIRLFDGSDAVSGDVTQYIDGSFLVPLINGKFFQSSLRLHVMWLSLADAIFGSSWMKSTNTIVGGVNNVVAVNGCISFLSSISNIKDTTSGMLLKEFSDVFVSQSLSSLPPHWKGFDGEVNFKEGFGSSFWANV